MCLHIPIGRYVMYVFIYVVAYVKSVKIMYLVQFIYSHDYNICSASGHLETTRNVFKMNKNILFKMAQLKYFF